MILLFLLVLLLLSILSVNLFNLKETMLKDREFAMRRLVENAISITDGFNQAAQRHLYSEEEAKARAKIARRLTIARALNEALQQAMAEDSSVMMMGEDVAKIQNSMLQKGEHFKYIEMPLSNYANSNYDQLTVGGKTVGVSLFSGYSYNERSFLSLATVDADVAIGNEVVLHWGEPNGGTRKTTVERHKQAEIRAIVSPVPYAVTAREAYAVGWRTGKK